MKSWDADEPLLVCDDVRKAYKDVVAVDGLSLTIPPGEIFALLGPNGAGKTTLIGCICGLVQHFDGQCRVAGYDVRQHYRLTRQLVGLVPQELNFDGLFNARNMLQYQQRMFGARHDRARVDELLRIFKLDNKAKANTRWLSGGMKRRLMITKALVHAPALLFLDEPTAGVDVELREELWAYVRRLREEGVTVFLTTHYLEEAEALADRIGILDRGRLRRVDTPARLQEEFGDERLHLRCDRPVPTAMVEALARYQAETGDEPSHLILHVRRHDGGHTTGAVFAAAQEVAREHGMRIDEVETQRVTLEDIFKTVLRRGDETPAEVSHA